MKFGLKQLGSLVDGYPPTPNSVPSRGTEAEILAGFVSPGGVLKGTTDITAPGLYGPAGTLNGQQLSLNVNGAGAITLTFNGLTSSATKAAMLAAIQATWPGLLATQSSGGVNLALRNLTPDGTIVVAAGTANATLGLVVGTSQILPNYGFLRLPSAASVGAPIFLASIQSSITPANSYTLIEADAFDILRLGDFTGSMPLYLAGGNTAATPADPNNSPSIWIGSTGASGIQSIQIETTRLYVGSPWDGGNTQLIIYPGSLVGAGAQVINFDDPTIGSFVHVNLNGDMTLAPLNAQDGGLYTIVVHQNGGATHVMTWDPLFNFGGSFNGTLTKLANATDVFAFVGSSAGILYCVGVSRNVTGLGGATKVTSQVAVTKATAQSIASDLAWHQLTNWDAGGIISDSIGTVPFNTITGTFTAPATGYYFVDVHIEYQSTSAPTTNAPFMVGIFVAGVLKAVNEFRSVGSGDGSAIPRDTGVSRMFYLTAGQTVWASAQQGGGVAISTQTDATRNMLSIFSVDGPVPSPSPPT